MKRLSTLIVRSVQSYNADRCSLYAAAIAYNAVFALFPLALLGVAALGYFIGDEPARQQVVSAITSVVTLGEAGEQALDRMLVQTNRASGWLGAIGLVISVWSASVLFSQIRAALDEIWGVRPMPLLRAKLRDVVLLFGFGGLLLASTMVSGFFITRLEQSAGVPASLQGVIGVILLVFASFSPLTFVAFLFVHRFGTHARLRWRDVWPAALITTVFFEVGRNIFTFYIRHLDSLNVLAGSLGAAILLLVWLNYGSRAALFAAEFAKHYALVRAGLMPPLDPPNTAQRALAERVRATVVGLWEPEDSARADAQPAGARGDPARDR